MLCSRIFLVAKKFMDKSGGGQKEGVSPFSIEKFLSLSANTFVGKSFWCLFIFRFQKIRIKEKGRESRFSAKNFLPQCRKFT